MQNQEFFIIEEDYHVFDDFLVDPFDPYDPVAYMIYEDVTKDDEDDDMD